MNPIRVKTKSAMKTLGRLLRHWSLDPAALPEGTKQAERGYLMSRETFVRVLAAEGAEEGRDYDLRAGIEEIEILHRREDRLSFLLPEKAILHDIEKEPGDTKVNVTSLELYRDDLSISTQKQMNIGSAIASESPTYELILTGDDPFDEFLDSYMASYSVTQCR